MEEKDVSKIVDIESKNTENVNNAVVSNSKDAVKLSSETLTSMVSVVNEHIKGTGNSAVGDNDSSKISAVTSVKDNSEILSINLKSVHSEISEVVIIDPVTKDCNLDLDTDRTANSLKSGRNGSNTSSEPLNEAENLTKKTDIQIHNTTTDKIKIKFRTKTDIIDITKDTKEKSEDKQVTDVIEIDEEDVPGDFFDDFMKEDFMAGLDIVDEDDEENEDKTKKEVASSPQYVLNPKAMEMRKNHKKIDHVKQFRKSPPGLKSQDKKIDEKREILRLKKVKEQEKQISKLNHDIERMRNKKAKKAEPGKSAIDADEFDIRRDPEKTKRDIQRDKDKCAKDRELKIINEKLSIVETGLVPPGMEMEADIDEIRRQDNVDKNKPPVDLRDRLKTIRGSPDTKKPSKSQEKDKKVKKHKLPITKSPISKRQRSNTPKPVRSVKKQPSGELTRVPRAKSPLLDRSRYNLSPTRRRSPRKSPVRRSPRRSPRRRTSLRKSRSRSRSRDRRSRSPLYYRRERSRDRRRDRSYSPVRRNRRTRSRSRSPIKSVRPSEKRSFLEELAEKLNETRSLVQSIHPHLGASNFSGPYQEPLPPPQLVTIPPPNIIPQPLRVPQIHHHELPATVPAPVPPPPMFFQPPQPPPMRMPPPQLDLYDQSFFIGEKQPQNVTPPAPVHNYPQQVKPVNTAPLMFHSPSNVSKPEMGPIPYESPQEISKLFQDKKIRLSEFLAITAKPQAHCLPTEKLREKIAVIQRSQAAMKILANPRKIFAGRLIVKAQKQDKQNVEVNCSPIVKSALIRLPFTTPRSMAENGSPFTKFCETFLDSLGLEMKPINQSDVIVLDDEPEPAMEKKKKYAINIKLGSTGESSLPPQVAAPPPPVERVIKIPKSLHNATQTDAKLSACKECEKRKNIRYHNEGVQCGDPALTFSVSTQCTESDFYSMIPKNQSLASLTPAQLLGRSIQQDTSPVKTYDTYSRMYSRSIDMFSTSGMRRPSPPPVHFTPTPRESISSLTPFSTFSSGSTGASLLRAPLRQTGGAPRGTSTSNSLTNRYTGFNSRF